MAPGITELSECSYEVKVDALKASSGYHGKGDGDAAATYGRQQQQVNMSPSASMGEESPVSFTMPSMHKLQEAQRRVEHDFRSDTVTVPTVHMMQVCGSAFKVVFLMDTSIYQVRAHG
jgi:threonine aldolase